MSEISLNNFINVSVSAPSKGLGNFNINTLLYITDDNTITNKPYYIFYNASAVATIFGTTSNTYKNLSIMFAQSPSLLAPGGYVIVIQRKSLTVANPTAGYTLTATLNTLDDLISIAEGSLTLVIDGVEETVDKIDLTSAKGLTEIATLLTTAFTTKASITADEEKQTLTFTSETTGITSSCIIKPVVNTLSEFLNTKQAIVMNGQTTGTVKESLNACIIRANGLIWFEGIIVDQLTINDSQDWLNASNYIQGTNQLLFYGENDFSNVGLATATSYKIFANNNYKTRLLYYSGANVSSVIALIGAYSSRGFAVDMTGTNTTLTMNLKDLSGISADSSIDDTSYQILQQYGFDFYAKVQGSLSKVVSTGKNMFFDDVFNLNWFVLQQLVAGFNTIATNSTKIPQTETGINLIKNALQMICSQAVRNGFIALGSWTSTDFFGNYDTFHRNILENGFYIYSAPITEQNYADRKDRKAPLIQMAIKFAGAFHSINIIINYNQ